MILVCEHCFESYNCPACQGLLSISGFAIFYTRVFLNIWIKGTYVLGEVIPPQKFKPV